MALNLWKLGGKPTSYNPLPSGWVNYITLGVNECKVSFKAKSQTSSKLNVQLNDVSFIQSITLTTDFKTYEYTFNNKLSQALWFRDLDTKGDIIIQDIQLVQKPLPTLTVNGIDGFASGKWTLHANARVIDDETLELNATADYQNSTLTIPCLPNTMYVMSGISDGLKVQINAPGNVVFTTDTLPRSFVSGNVTVMTIYITNATWRGVLRFKKPMLNLGTISAPYEKKRGERMVLPVTKKNLFDGALELGDINTTTGLNGVNDTRTRSVNYSKVEPNKNYSQSSPKNQLMESIYFYDSSKVFISRVSGSPLTFTTPSNAYYVRGRGLYADVVNQWQLEEGTTATPYTPYAVQINAKPKRAIIPAKSGVAFNGQADYLQLPSMAMDSIEIDCLIDSVQSGNAKIVDARSGLVNSWLIRNNTGFIVGDGWIFSQGLQVNQRTKILLKSTQPFTDNVNIMSSSGSLEFAKGILYGIKCTLNGQVVAQYDANNIVGDKLLQKAVNLIPSFEDSRWSLHSNFKVLGKDVGRLESTATFQNSQVVVDVTPNKTYKFYCPNISFAIDFVNDVDSVRIQLSTGSDILVTIPSNCTKLKMVFRNGSVGTFDFIKPQLYQLDGIEGTLVGSPTKLKRASKRTLYAKR